MYFADSLLTLMQSWIEGFVQYSLCRLKHQMALSVAYDSGLGALGKFAIHKEKMRKGGWLFPGQDPIDSLEMQKLNRIFMPQCKKVDYNDLIIEFTTIDMKMKSSVYNA